MDNHPKKGQLRTERKPPFLAHLPTLLKPPILAPLRTVLNHQKIMRLSRYQVLRQLIQCKAINHKGNT